MLTLCIVAKLACRCISRTLVLVLHSRVQEESIGPGAVCTGVDEQSCNGTGRRSTDLGTLHHVCVWGRFCLSYISMSCTDNGLVVLFEYVAASNTAHLDANNDVLTLGNVTNVMNIWRMCHQTQL